MHIFGEKGGVGRTESILFHLVRVAFFWW